MTQNFTSDGQVLEFQLQHQFFQWILEYSIFHWIFYSIFNGIFQWILELGLISFRMDWLHLLTVQGTLKSLQYHSSKESILWLSAFFIVQLSHPYMITGKTIALTRQTVVEKEMSLLFGMLSRFVIALLPRSKHRLISWLQSPSAVILEPPKIKPATVSTSICHEVMGPEAMILVF